MAKISPVSIKYMIHANFSVEGFLEKPDVIGALFGQTEGLLGSDLEMRELQKEGKIGRIEVELEERVLRHSCSPLRREHDLPLPCRRNTLDKVRRYGLACRVLALTGFHFVTHQHLHVHHAVLGHRADAHRICHFSFS